MTRLAIALCAAVLTSCAGTVVRDGGFVVVHRGNVGVLTQTADNGAGSLALGTGPGNGVTVARQIVEVEGSQPASIEIMTPSGGVVAIKGAVSYSTPDEAVGSAINRGLRTGMIGRGISTVTGGVVDIAKEGIDAATE